MNQGRSVLQTARGTFTRIGEIRGSQLVDSLVLRLFLSLFPLLVIAIAVLGFVAANKAGGSPAMADQIINNLKLKDQMADLLRDLVESAESSRGTASIVGFVGVVFSGLSVVGSISGMCNAVWQVAARGPIDRLIGLVWLVGAIALAAAVGATTALVSIINVPFVNTAVGFLSGVVSVSLLFWWTQFVMTNVRVRPRAFVPGAIVGAIGASLFQVFGAVLVERILKSASGGAAPIAAIVAFLTFFSVFGRLFLISVVINVVLWERRNGTADLVIRAPMISGAPWVETKRGGQRGRRNSPRSLKRRLSKRVSQRR